MADEAIQYMKGIKAVAPEKPFFVYYVPGGTHAPHHPTPEWIEKISDMKLFDGGWNKLRETIFANQKRLGIMPANAQLTPWPKELPEWDSLGAVEKRLFIKQMNVYAAYLAYTDHEIGRVIQAVEDMGQRDNTLIIYITGDNGPSSEGLRNGTPNEFTAFNGVAMEVNPQLLWYPFWGSERDLPALRGRLGVGDGHAVQVGEAGGFALRRDGARHGHVVARPHQGPGRHPPPVPSRHRHRADHPRSHRHPAARHDQRHQAAPDGRREHGLHLGQGERKRADPAHHAVLRDARQPRDLPRRLGRGDDPGDAPVGTEHQAGARRDHRVQVGALPRRRRIPPSTTTSRPRCRTS